MSQPNTLGRRIMPAPLNASTDITTLVNALTAYNGARLNEGCRLLAEKMLEPNVTIGLTISGALTPAGLGISCFIPLIEAGFVDWIISTGANLYHDTHFALGFDMFQSGPNHDDLALRNDEVIRIYDILFNYDVLLDTDAFFRQIIQGPEFQKSMSTAEFHHLCGKYIAERERQLGIGGVSLLSAAYRCDVPVYTSSPGDSSIGMNVAAAEMRGNGLRLNPTLDVTETASIVYGAKADKGKSAVWILGGGSPKNFALQTEPQIQEVLGLSEAGHDYFLQITDARVDTGGLSGATPSEAVSWGKIDPQRLPDAVVCYCDTTIAAPVLTAYALANRPPRPLKRLYQRLPELTNALMEADRANREE
ncbi:MAG TPA: deoxyhypusine synthase [Armatimonadota bacterium]|jgi:deoxyhypusine synthase